MFTNTSINQRLFNKNSNLNMFTWIKASLIKLGLGTNKRALIETLCCRSSKQRQEIREHYLRKYKRDLILDLKSYLSGDFGEAMDILMKEEYERNAFYLRKALYSIPVDLRVIIEILVDKQKPNVYKTIFAYERSILLRLCYY